MTKTWLEPVQADIEQLRQAATALGGATVEERQRAFEAKASEIRGLARNIAARSNQLGKSTAGEMRALATTVAVAPGSTGFLGAGRSSPSSSFAKAMYFCNAL